MSGVIGVSPVMRSGVVGKYPVGHVIQIVTGHNTARVATTAAWDNDLIFEKTITLANSTNKVYVMMTYGVYMDGDGLFTGGTSIARTNSGSNVRIADRYHYRNAATSKMHSSSMNTLDTPAPSGTLDVVYSLRFTGDTNTGSISSDRVATVFGSDSISQANITLMEIQA